MKKLLSLLMALTLISGCVSGLSLTANASSDEFTAITPTEELPDGIISIKTKSSTPWKIVNGIHFGSATETTTTKAHHDATGVSYVSQSDGLDLEGAIAIQTTFADVNDSRFASNTNISIITWAQLELSQSAEVYILSYSPASNNYMKFLSRDEWEIVYNSDGSTQATVHTKNNTDVKYDFEAYKKTFKILDGETVTVDLCNIGNLYNSENMYFVAIKFIDNLKNSDLVSSHNQVFNSNEAFTLDNGETYEGPSGVVFATAVETLGGLNRTEFGVAISEEELTADEFKTSKNVEFAKADDDKITADYKYGVRFFGSRVKAGKTFYTLPYAKYTDSFGKEITVFGSEVLNFTPNAQ